MPSLATRQRDLEWNHRNKPQSNKLLVEFMINPVATNIAFIARTLLTNKPYGAYEKTNLILRTVSCVWSEPAMNITKSAWGYSNTPLELHATLGATKSTQVPQATI